MDPSTFAGVEATGGVNIPILSRNEMAWSKYLKTVHFAQRAGFKPGNWVEAIILPLKNYFGYLPTTLERE